VGPLQTITTSLTLAVAGLITGCDNSPIHSKPPPSSHANTQNLNQELAKPIKNDTVSKFLQDKNLKLKDLKEYSKYLESATDIGPKDFDSVAEFIVSLFKQPDKISETMNSIKPEILEDLYKIIDLLKTHTKNWKQIQKINPDTDRTFYGHPPVY
jgi:DNA-directed RNA polymerase subunit F